MTQSEQLDCPEIAFWQALSRAHATVLTALEQELEQGSVTPIGLEVLRTLGACTNRQMRMADVAKTVGLSRSGLTRLMDRLQRHGWVERRHCPDDGRGAFAVLTDCGQHTLDRVLPTYRATLERCLSPAVHHGDMEAVTDALIRLRVDSRSSGRNAPRQLEHRTVPGTVERGQAHDK